MSEILQSVSVTTRKVCNEETGLDLYIHGQQQVTSKRTIKAAVYDVIVVSNLPSFSAEEGKTVQYALVKSYSDLQKLHSNLTKRFPGTLIPEFPKKPIPIIDTTVKTKERMKQYEAFLQFCAKTPKIVSSDHLLKFLVANEVIPSQSNESEAQLNDQIDQRYVKQRISKVELFDDAVGAEDQIFGEDDEEAGPDLAEYRPISTKWIMDSNILADRNSARLYKEPDVLVQRESKTLTGDNMSAEKEEVYSNHDDSGDDNFESLMARLDDVKKFRAKREEEWTAQAAIHFDDSKVDQVNIKVDDMGFDDVAKYISENSATTTFNE